MSYNSNVSYRRYRQYRANKQQYKVDQVAAPIVVVIIIGILTKYFWVILGGYFLIALVCAIVRGTKANKEEKTEIENEYKKAQRETSGTQMESDIKYEREERIIGMKSTEIGYVNKNNQQNKGKSEKSGTDHMQWFYHMECLNCGNKYYANGSDIWQRKCPTCQGGKA